MVGFPKLSADGRYAVFRSGAGNLDSPASGQQDVYLHDLLLHQTERVSLTESGDHANGWSDVPAVSANGRFVSFVTYANNLVAGDTNGDRDVYVRDRQEGTTIRVSLSTAGDQSNNDSWPANMSDDGRYILFNTRSGVMHPDGDTRSHFYRRDILTGTTERMTENSLGQPANQDCAGGFLSAGGDWIVFSTTSTNLDAPDTNGKHDIFVRDLSSGVTQRISNGFAGDQTNGNSTRPSISANGRWVAFESTASNLVPGDTNGTSDVFLFDRVTGTTERINRQMDGSETGGTTTKVRISADGSTVVFQANDSSIVAGDANGTTDVFAFDRTTGVTTNMNVGSNGSYGDRWASNATISADGNRVMFAGASTRLIGGARNFDGHLYVHERVPSTSDPIQFAGPGHAEVGDTVHYYWANGSPNARFWFSYSLSNSGRFQYGHQFDLGGPARTLFADFLDGNGAERTSAVIPSSAAGLTLYLEMVAFDGITIEDSNMLTLEIAP